MKRDIDMVMLKLADGARILRFTEPASGLSLEKRVDPQKPVLSQQQRWKQVFEAMIEQELGSPSASA